MKKRTKFIITTLWILLSRSYDVLATYQYTPDLKHEANPLASIFNFGWMTIIPIVAIITGYIIYAYYQSTFKSYPLHPQEKGYSFWQFATYLYLGKPAHWTATMYQLPKDKKRLHFYLGKVLTRCLAFAGIVSTVMWLLINYTGFYKQYHSAFAVYSILAVGCVLISAQWMKEEYKIYQLETLRA